MKKIEEFMAEYFSAKIEDEIHYQRDRLNFRRQFYSENCRYDSHTVTLDRLKSEKVVSIEQNDTDVYVITEFQYCFNGHNIMLKLRYQLQSFNGTWLIKNVQTACSMCDTIGNMDCISCKGKYWLSGCYGINCYRTF
jgi:hypothetical protein